MTNQKKQNKKKTDPPSPFTPIVPSFVRNNNEITIFKSFSFRRTEAQGLTTANRNNI